MNLKVKIKTHDILIVYIDVPDSITLDETVKHLVDLGHLDAQFADVFPQDEEMYALFDSTGRVIVADTGIELTFTKKRVGQKVENLASKLNYQIFLPTVQLYRELVTTNQVKFGTLFFIQVDKETYLIRHNRNDVELFDFKTSFEALQRGDKASPVSRIHFKTRDELNMSEMAFIRSISFPVKERKNPILEVDVLSQERIDWMADLVDYVTQIIKHFEQHNVGLDRSEKDYPTYIFQNGKPTIGFVKEAQLQKIAEAAKQQD